MKPLHRIAVRCAGSAWQFAKAPGLVVLLLLLLAPGAWAHETRWDTVRVVRNGRAVVVAAQLHGSTLPTKNYAAEIESRLHLTAQGKALQAPHGTVEYDAANDWVTWQAALPPGSQSVRLTDSLIPGRDTILLTFSDGRQTGAEMVSSHAAPENRSPVHFIGLGVEHILTGIDHIAFILLVLLAGGGWVRQLKTLSLFTLAHSVTLAMAALGVWAPSSRIVEPLIALSIVYQAAALLIDREKALRHQGWIVAGFGLVHGFGFAGAIAEIGFPKDFIVPSLLGFNIGIELGQLGIACLVVPLLLLADKWRAEWTPRLVSSGAFALGSLGCFLAVQRIFGLG